MGSGAGHAWNKKDTHVKFYVTVLLQLGTGFVPMLGFRTHRFCDAREAHQHDCFADGLPAIDSR